MPRISLFSLPPYHLRKAVQHLCHQCAGCLVLWAEYAAFSGVDAVFHRPCHRVCRPIGHACLISVPGQGGFRGGEASSILCVPRQDHDRLLYGDLVVQPKDLLVVALDDPGSRCPVHVGRVPFAKRNVRKARGGEVFRLDGGKSSKHGDEHGAGHRSLRRKFRRGYALEQPVFVYKRYSGMIAVLRGNVTERIFPRCFPFARVHVGEFVLGVVRAVVSAPFVPIFSGTAIVVRSRVVCGIVGVRGGFRDRLALCDELAAIHAVAVPGIAVLVRGGTCGIADLQLAVVIRVEREGDGWQLRFFLRIGEIFPAGRAVPVSEIARRGTGGFPCGGKGERMRAGERFGNGHSGVVGAQIGHGIPGARGDLHPVEREGIGAGRGIAAHGDGYGGDLGHGQIGEIAAGHDGDEIRAVRHQIHIDPRNALDGRRSNVCDHEILPLRHIEREAVKGAGEGDGIGKAAPGRDRSDVRRRVDRHGIDSQRRQSQNREGKGQREKDG